MYSPYHYSETMFGRSKMPQTTSLNYGQESRASVLCCVAACVGVGTVDPPMTHRTKRLLADETMDQHCFFQCCYEETGVDIVSGQYTGD